MWVFLLGSLALACALAPPESTAWMARIASGRLPQGLFAYSVRDPSTGNLWYWTSPLFDLILALLTDRGLLSPHAVRTGLLLLLFAGGCLLLRPRSARGGLTYAAFASLLLTGYVSSQADLHPGFIAPLFFLWIGAPPNKEAPPSAAPLVLALWSAIHESFLLGWLWLAASAAHRRDWKSLAFLLALLLTPWGARALMLWTLDPPPLLAGAGVADLLVLAFVLVALGSRFRQESGSWRSGAALLGLSCLYFWTARALALAWSLAVISPLAERLGKTPRMKLLRQDLHRGSTPDLVGALLLGAALFIAFRSLSACCGLHDPWSEPLKAHHNEIPSQARLCAPLSLYNTALYLGLPLRPLADARGLYLYPLRDLQTAARIERGEPFNPESWGCGALWVAKESALFNYVMQMTPWVPILQIKDPPAVVMVPASEKLLGRVPAAYQDDAKQKLIELWVEQAREDAGAKRLDAAAGKLRRALKLRRDATLLSNLAAVYLEKNELERAKPLLDEALTLQPTHIPARMNLGLYHERRGALKEAASYYEWVTDFHPENQLAREALARVMKQLDPNYVPPGKKPQQSKRRLAPPPP